MCDAGRRVSADGRRQPACYRRRPVVDPSNEHMRQVGKCGRRSHFTYKSPRVAPSLRGDSYIHPPRPNDPKGSASRWDSKCRMLVLDRGASHSAWPLSRLAQPPVSPGVAPTTAGGTYKGASAAVGRMSGLDGADGAVVAKGQLLLDVAESSIGEQSRELAT